MLDMIDADDDIDTEYRDIMDNLLSIRCALNVIGHRELLSRKERELADQAWRTLVELDVDLRNRLGDPPSYTSRLR